MIMVRWAEILTTQLGAIDPDNAGLYRSRFAAWEITMQRLDEELANVFATIDGAIIVPHDAYRYLAHRYGLTVAAAIAESDASDPGLSHVQELDELVEGGGIACVLSDPETGTRIAESLIEGTSLRTAMVDPMGASIVPGPDHYLQMMRELGDTIATCASGT